MCNLTAVLTDLEQPNGRVPGGSVFAATGVGSRDLSGGRPQIDTELRVLIRRISIENPLWGAPRIDGELLKLGFEVAQSSAAKYMVKRHGTPNQRWRTFLRNHAPGIVAMDLFVAPTIGFDLLYAHWSSFGWTAQTSSGSTSQRNRRRVGSHVRSRRHFSLE